VRRGMGGGVERRFCGVREEVKGGLEGFVGWRVLSSGGSGVASFVGLNLQGVEVEEVVVEFVRWALFVRRASSWMQGFPHRGFVGNTGLVGWW